MRSLLRWQQLWGVTPRSGPCGSGARPPVMCDQKSVKCEIFEWCLQYFTSGVLKCKQAPLQLFSPDCTAALLHTDRPEIILLLSFRFSSNTNKMHASFQICQSAQIHCKHTCPCRLAAASSRATSRLPTRETLRGATCVCGYNIKKGIEITMTGSHGAVGRYLDALCQWQMSDEILFSQTVWGVHRRQATSPNKLSYSSTQH